MGVWFFKVCYFRGSYVWCLKRFRSWLCLSFPFIVLANLLNLTNGSDNSIVLRRFFFEEDSSVFKNSHDTYSLSFWVWILTYQQGWNGCCYFLVDCVLFWLMFGSLCYAVNELEGGKENKICWFNWFEIIWKQDDHWCASIYDSKR